MVFFFEILTENKPELGYSGAIETRREAAVWRISLKIGRSGNDAFMI